MSRLNLPWQHFNPNLVFINTSRERENRPAGLYCLTVWCFLCKALIRNDICACAIAMDNTLKQLSANALRNLLIQETRAFIECLDTGNSELLNARRLRLKEIHELIDEKELLHSSPLRWGKNSSGSTAQ